MTPGMAAGGHEATPNPPKFPDEAASPGPFRLPNNGVVDVVAVQFFADQVERALGKQGKHLLFPP